MSKTIPVDPDVLAARRDEVTLRLRLISAQLAAVRDLVYTLLAVPAEDAPGLDNLQQDPFKDVSE